jgi:hypothetical protein
MARMGASIKLRKLIRSIAVLPGEPLIEDRLRIYKDNSGYSVYFNRDQLALCPLTKDGYAQALQYLFDRQQTEQAIYL